MKIVNALKSVMVLVCLSGIMKKVMLFFIFSICLFGMNNNLTAQLISTQSYLPETHQSGSAAFSATSDGSSGFASHVRAIIGRIESGYGYTYGVHGIAYSNKESNQGRAYGVMGMAGNAGINYGVYGHLRGENRGTAILGHDGEFSSSASLFSGKWAGYFIGNVNVTKDVFASSFNVSSDKRLKKNIKNIENPLDKIMKINGVNYEYKTEEFSKKQLRKGIQTGLIAQEVELIAPDAVADDQQGFKAVDYSRIVPILVEGMKAQQEMIELQQIDIETLKKKIEALNNASNNPSDNTLIDFQTETNPTIYLKSYPNPVDKIAKVEFSLSNATKVSLRVIDAMGRNLIDVLEGTTMEAGNYTKEINTADLSKGTYFIQLQTSEEVSNIQVIKN